MPWAEIEPILKDRAYRKIESEPEFLFEQDAWFDLDADLFYARLIGFDDEVVKDVRLSKVEHDILMPIYQPTWKIAQETLDEAFLNKAGILSPTLIEPTIRTARYTLQSNFVTLHVSAFVYEIPVEKLRDDFTAKVAYLRYKRRA